MRTILICASRTIHANTAQLAAAIAEPLAARVLDLEQATSAEIAAVDRVGFGSGIYYMNFDRGLRRFIDALPDMTGRSAFLFATSGRPETALRRYRTTMQRKVVGRGFTHAGTFVCRGHDTWGPYRLVGGVNTTSPTPGDLDRAAEFARALSVRGV